MKDQRREVCLYGLEQLALIIKMKSSVTYTNQTGGGSCMQPAVEGILMILDDETKSIANGLNDITLNKTYLTTKDADMIDLLFRTNRVDYMMVDRRRLEDSMEAWLYVLIDNSKTENSMFKGFIENEGVITWNNSD